MKYRVVVIGAGNIAVRHLQALAQTEGFQTVAVADIVEHRAEQLSRTFDIKAYKDYKQMIVNEKPDAAVITLPHFLHKESAVFCACSRCHIFLEKPMALTTQECDDMIESAEKHRVCLMVGHSQHYIATNLAAKRWMESGDPGELVMVTDTRNVNYFQENRPDWYLQKNKSGGGIMMNLGSHSIDKIQWLTGGRFVKAHAKLSFHGARGDVEGSGLVYLETDRGVPVVISQSGYGGEVLDETKLVFTKGVLKLRTGIGLWAGKDGRYEEVDVQAALPPAVLQFHDFYDAIGGDVRYYLSGSYARTVIRTVEAVYLSHARGKEIRLITDE